MNNKLKILSIVFIIIIFTYVNVSATTTNYECENGTLVGSAGIGTSVANASNSSVVNNLNNTGDGVIINNINSSGGTATLIVRSSNGNAPTATLSIYVNNVFSQTYTRATTGSWTTFADSTTLVINLNNSTTNTIKLIRESGQQSQDLDRIVVNNNPYTATPTPSPSVTPSSTPTRSPTPSLTPTLSPTPTTINTPQPTNSDYIYITQRLDKNNDYTKYVFYSLFILIIFEFYRLFKGVA